MWLLLDINSISHIWGVQLATATLDLILHDPEKLSCEKEVYQNIQFMIYILHI